MPIWMIAIIAVLVLFIVLVVFAAIMNERRKQQERRQSLLLLGFQAIEPEADLAERLIALHRTSPEQHYHLSDVYGLQEHDHQIYTYELSQSGGTDASPSVGSHMAVFSPNLHLPRFILIPRLGGAGSLGNMLSGLLERAKPGNLTHIVMDDPLFERNYQVFGEQEEAVKALFTPRRMGWLGSAQDYMVMGEGNAFLFTRFNLNELRSGKIDEAEMLQGARAVFKVLEEDRW